MKQTGHMKGLTWSVIEGTDQKRHVIPNEDLRPHNRHTGCWCGPTPDDMDEGVIVHHAMDWREKNEGTYQ
jgi:hypothetical protein